MLQFEGIDNIAYNGCVMGIEEAFRRAYAFRITGFKIYNKEGHFLREYALFDGKYRKVMTEEETHDHFLGV